jgi:hypothetical protein
VGAPASKRSLTRTVKRVFVLLVGDADRLATSMNERSRRVSE